MTTSARPPGIVVLLIRIERLRRTLGFSPAEALLLLLGELQAERDIRRAAAERGDVDDPAWCHGL